MSLLAGQAVFAADMPASMPVKAPPLVAPAPLWAGWYVGGHVGYSWGSVDGDMTHNVVVPAGNFPIFPFANVGVVPFPGVTREVDPRGPLAGIQGGYNFQSGRVVYGLEGDVSWTGQGDASILDLRRNAFLTEDYIYRQNLRTELQVIGTLRGRFGYTFGQFLPYVTGGLAWGRMKADLSWSLTQLFGPTATFSGSETQTLLGFAVGAGFEYALAQKWSVKAEYLYLDLGKETYFSGIQGGGQFGLRDHTLRLGFNYHL